MSRGKRLPPGPKLLSRDQVVQSQRERLLEGMAEAVAEKGYARTSVADVIERAEVSRATFYQLFDNKDDCFRAAFDAFAARLAELLASVLQGLKLAGNVPPMVKLDRVVTAYLAVLQGAPAHARVFLVEVYAAGPDAVRQRQESLERFIDVVAETHRGCRGLLGTEPEQRFAVTAVVQAVSAMVTNAVAMNDFEALAELRGPLIELAGKISDIDPQR